jgi:hypothetical protein
MGQRHQVYMLAKNKYGGFSFTAFHNQDHPYQDQGDTAIEFYKEFMALRENEAFLSTGDFEHIFKAVTFIRRHESLSWFVDTTHEYIKDGQPLFTEDNNNGWMFIYIEEEQSTKSPKMRRPIWNVSIGCRIGKDDLRKLSNEDQVEFKDQWLPIGTYLELVGAEDGHPYLKNHDEAMIEAITLTFDQDLMEFGEGLINSVIGTGEPKTKIKLKMPKAVKLIS